MTRKLPVTDNPARRALAVVGPYVPSWITTFSVVHLPHMPGNRVIIVLEVTLDRPLLAVGADSKPMQRLGTRTQVEFGPGVGDVIVLGHVGQALQQLVATLKAHGVETPPLEDRYRTGAKLVTGPNAGCVYVRGLTVAQDYLVTPDGRLISAVDVLPSAPGGGDA